MIRGVNKTLIFLDEEDKRYFLQVLFKVQKISGFILFAYCIMDNHVHLVIKEGDELLPEIMKRINVRYATYFNKKYGRVGYLFQSRYRSETIETDSRLIECIRYVHNNPCKAYLVHQPDGYLWSSYRAYLEKEEGTKLLDTEFVLGLFANIRSVAQKKFAIFSALDAEDNFIDIEKDLDEKRREAEVVIKEILAKHKITTESLASTNLALRAQILREIREKVNLPAKVLAEMLGVSVHLIYRA
ncbi:transposase [Dethiobacter alkaliphilus]|nr:transposase [Dethiobacter alkaliphilus]